MGDTPESSPIKKGSFSSLNRVKKKSSSTSSTSSTALSTNKTQQVPFNFTSPLNHANPSKISPPLPSSDHTVPNTYRHKKPSSETGLISLSQLNKSCSKNLKQSKNRPFLKRQKFPMDKLSNSSNSLQKLSRSKYKPSVHIANISSSRDDQNTENYIDRENMINQRKNIERENSLITNGEDEVLNLIESSSKIGENTKALISNIEKIKQKSTSNNLKATANTNNIETLLRNDSIINLGNDSIDLDDPDNQLVSIDNVMGDDLMKIKKIEEKYHLLTNFNPPILSKKELLEKSSKYLIIIKDILNGKQSSYFYELARQLSTSSSRSIISDMEIINLPKNIYHGYYGLLRQHIIAEYIQDHLKSLLHSKNKFNNVIQFWGTRYFTLYVLTPEVVARLMVEDMNYSGDALEKAYDDMEATNDYGLYIMDKHNPEDKQEIHNEKKQEQEQKQEQKQELIKNKIVKSQFWKPTQFDDISSDEGDFEEGDLFKR